MPPQHEPNQPITLANTSIVEVDGQPAEALVNVLLRLLPSPTVVIEADALPNVVLSKERFRVRLGNAAELEAMVRSFNPGTGQGSLIPALQPVDVVDKGLPIRKVNFGVLNFPEVYGNQTIEVSDGGEPTTVPHAKLDVSDWCVEITGLSNIRDVAKTLKQDKGYALTYTGVVTHRDGTEFSVKTVERLLTALRLFLSFARGACCSLALVEGIDQNGQQSWLRWGAHHAEPGIRINSWFRQLNGADTLAELFPKFWSLFESDQGWRDGISRAVDWYLQSNISPPYIGIILTVAALERLSAQVLARPRKGKLGEFIKNALDELQVPLDLPKGYQALRKIENWEHGPHAVVEIRNDLIHPKRKYDPVSDYAIHEAWNVGQWYIEMLLLGKLKYRGFHSNRLAGWREHDQRILPVPWTKEP